MQLNNSTIQQLNNSTTQQFNNSITQQFNNSTTQQFNNSTIQQFNNSTIQQFNNSTIQQLNNSTTQQLNNSPLASLDTDLFLFLNGFHTPALDPIMAWISAQESWYPLYALFIIWLLKVYKMPSLGMLLCIVVAVIIGDQVTSSILKPLIARPRPCHETHLLVHLVGNCGGAYGFASSHAANGFAFATSVFLLVGKQFRWAVLLFIWATLLAYSRIYVGVHYPLDVLAGAGVGTLGGLLSVWLFRRLFGKVAAVIP